jgi:hypothetical protein
VSGVGSPGDDEGTGSPAGDFEVGGLIRMAEGGEPPTPPKMTELSPSDLGSTFDINDYIEKGILVGGCRSLFVMSTARLLGIKATCRK